MKRLLIVVLMLVLFSTGIPPTADAAETAIATLSISAIAVEIHGNDLFAASATVLYKYDVTTPASPTLTWSTGVAQRPLEIVANDTYVAVRHKNGFSFADHTDVCTEGVVYEAVGDAVADIDITDTDESKLWVGALNALHYYDISGSSATEVDNIVVNQIQVIDAVDTPDVYVVHQDPDGTGTVLSLYRIHDGANILLWTLTWLEQSANQITVDDIGISNDVIYLVYASGHELEDISLALAAYDILPFGFGIVPGSSAALPYSGHLFASDNYIRIGSGAKTLVFSRTNRLFTYEGEHEYSGVIGFLDVSEKLDTLHATAEGSRVNIFNIPSL